MTVKKMTSYKVNKNKEKVPVKDDEKADIISIKSIGNINNIFKVVELTSGYKYLTTPTKQTLKKDAVNEILR